MPNFAASETIRILVATDNHVGYQETHPVRGDDSWKTFHEIMGLAKEKDVDMVLLGGDLFDKHTPSRKSMVNVIRSLRENVLGDKPCELEFLGDGSEIFGGRFNHVNYEDQDINVAIPVFSIHGNHDEPTGHEFYCALDVLQETGLINYFGRVPKNDNIEVKPVLLQKGRTKLALFGLSNVRDERLFREFRRGNVKFFQPSVQQNEWFNLMVVHQNHVPRTSTGYLPEDFLPDFVDLVIWGHEHDCVMEPRQNSDRNFHVIQPGSSVATQLMPGEALDKHVGILTVQGQEFSWHPIRLKTVRPFVMRDIKLAEQPSIKKLATKKGNHRPELSRFLKSTINDMIIEANEKWTETQGNDIEEDAEPPLPLLRLRVDYTTPDGGTFDCENAQRITNEFIDKVANHDEIILYHQKKSYRGRKQEEAELPDAAIMEQLTLESIKVEDLVREFLVAQTLQIFPQNQFGESVNSFITGANSKVMTEFVHSNLDKQQKYLLDQVDIEEVDLEAKINDFREAQEEAYSAGKSTEKTTSRYKPKPSTWDDELDGVWEEQPQALIVEVVNEDAMDVTPPAPSPSAAVITSARGRGRGRGGRAAAASTRKTAAAPKVAPKGRGTKKKIPFVEEDSDEESDEAMLLDEDEVEAVPESDEDPDELFVTPAPTTTTRRRGNSNASTTTKKAPTGRAKAAPKAVAQQTKLNFSQPMQTQRAAPARSAARGKKVIEISDDDIDDEDDAFEPVAAPSRSKRR